MSDSRLIKCCVLATVTLSLCATIESADAQSGLHGMYFAGGFADDGDCLPEGSESFERVDEEIDFNWADGPPRDGFCNGSFAIRWTGTITAEVDGPHLLTLTANDGARLFLDHDLVIDGWRNAGSRLLSALVEMEAGVEVPIAFDYYDGAAYADVQFTWTPPGGEYEVVPSRVLSPLPPPPVEETTVGVYMIDDLMLEGVLLSPYGRYGLDAVTVTVWRSGPLEDELSLSLSPRGDALPGLDYAFPTFVRDLTFGPNESGITFTIGQVDDNFYRGDRIAEIVFVPSEAFAVHPEHSSIIFEIRDDEIVSPEVGFTIAGTIEGAAPRSRWLVRATGEAEDRATGRFGAGTFGLSPVSAGTFLVEVFNDEDEDGLWDELEQGEQREVVVPPHRLDLLFTFAPPPEPVQDAGGDIDSTEDEGSEATDAAEEADSAEDSGSSQPDLPEDDEPNPSPAPDEPSERLPAQEQGCSVTSGQTGRAGAVWLLMMVLIAWRAKGK